MNIAGAGEGWRVGVGMSALEVDVACVLELDTILGSGESIDSIVRGLVCGSMGAGAIIGAAAGWVEGSTARKGCVWRNEHTVP